MRRVVFRLVLILILQNCLYFRLLANDCLSSEANRIQVDLDILIAIARQESNFNSKAFNNNKNGSQDFGLMQINSEWLSILKRAGYRPEDLYHPCNSIRVSAWILKQSFAIYGRTWEAIGAYNVGTKKGTQYNKLRKLYAQKIYSHYISLKLHPLHRKEAYERIFHL